MRPIPRWFDLLFKHGYPPLWLRPVTPWRLLEWLDVRYAFCWTSIVSWKQLSMDSNWTPDHSCREPHDYCGKFDIGVDIARRHR